MVDAVAFLVAHPEFVNRTVIAVSTHGRGGKDTLMRYLMDFSFWRRLGILPISTTDITNFIASKKGFAGKYRGEAVIGVNYAMGMVARLGGRDCDEEVAVLETCTDLGKEIGAAYYGINIVSIAGLLLIFGNEPLTATRSAYRPKGALLNKTVMQIDVRCDAGDEAQWMSQAPGDVRWHFPGEPPQCVLPTGRMGDVARPLRGADVDGRQAVLRRWRTQSLPSWDAVVAGGVADGEVCGSADIATFLTLTSGWTPAQYASMRAVLRRVWQMGATRIPF